MNSLTIALAQLNFTVGDIDGNVEKIRAARALAATEKADLVIFPELAVTGYPPEDLVLRKRFQDAEMLAVEKLAAETVTAGPAMLLGGLWREGENLFNATMLLYGGTIQAVQHKVALPNYGVFDEKRVFTAGKEMDVMRWRGINLGVLVCEDMWDEKVPRAMAKKGAELFIVQNASPYETGKAGRRKKVAWDVARMHKTPLIYLNLVGGQDELVFDGRSFILSDKGEDVGRLQAFTEEVAITRWKRSGDGWECTNAPFYKSQNDQETIYQAMILGLRDYVNKNGFKGVVIGMSGGIDSGLTAAVAVDALGAERVHGVMMPSPYTSQESTDDAVACAKALGMSLDTINITAAMQGYDEMLKDVFKGAAKDTTEENIQARIRGNILMAISNKLGYMVLTTGNKSEMSVGYATLYGDMCGGYSVIKDVYKTTVYAVAQWRNTNVPPIALSNAKDVIPQNMLTKAPTAELKPNQKDQDTLPPYPQLDAILLRLNEQRLSIEDIVDQGYDPAIVERVAHMLYGAEYKRRQSPPGVKLSGMSFGRDRRYPITNGFKG